MKNTYIEKLLSHIGNKKHKQQIEYELIDHITEKENWYMEIEYDPETASSRAEEDMGEPDIAGEELAAIHHSTDKKSRIITALMLWIPIAGYFISVLESRGGEGMFSFELSDMFSGFFICFMLAVMIYAFKKQRIAAVVFSSLCCALTLRLENFWFLFLTTGKDIGRYFFHNTYDFLESDGYIFDVYLSDNGVSYYTINMLRMIFPIIILTYAIVSTLIIIKNRLMLNRKYDYYIGKGLRIFLSVFATAILMSSLIQSCNMMNFTAKYTEYVKESMPEQNRKVLDAIYEFKRNERQDFSDILIEINFKTNPYCRTQIERKGLSDDFSVYTQAADYNNFFDGGILEPFKKETADSVIEFVRSGGKYIEDAPMNGELTFDGEDRITMSYYTDYYGMNCLVFDYIDGRFQLTGTQLCTNPDIKLTDEQLKQFFDTFRTECTEIDKYLAQINDPRYELYMLSKTFGVTYNDIDDEYTIYFDYCPLGFTKIDGKLYVSRAYYLYDLYEDEYKVNFRFDDGKVIIINQERSYNSDLDIFESKYEMFSRSLNRKGVKELNNWGVISEKFTEVNGERLGFFERTNSVVKFAKRNFISEPLTGSIVYDPDGTYRTYDHSVSEMESIKNIRLISNE